MESPASASRWTKHLGLFGGIILACSANFHADAQIVTSTERRIALKGLLTAIKTPPFYGMDWHALKLAVVDEQAANQLKDALRRSKRRADDTMEQGLWVDAAAGHPEAALAFYDNNVLKHPEDKTLANAACWARAAHGLDLQHAVGVCDAALAADRQGYTLVFRGMAELQLGLLDEALRDFDEALGNKAFRSHPSLADAAFGRGIARLRLNDLGGSKDIEMAVSANNRVTTRFADIGIIR